MKNGNDLEPPPPPPPVRSFMFALPRRAGGARKKRLQFPVGRVRRHLKLGR